MKVKSLLGLTAACAVGLTLSITLPLVLTTRNKSQPDQDQNDILISFSGNEKPVTANKQVTITGNVNKPGNYIFSWCYSKDLSNWVEIPKAKTNQLNIPANKATTKLNDYHFRLTVGNPNNGKTYSATTKIKVVDSRLSVSNVNVDRYTAIVDITPINFSVNASTCLSDASLSYQWQYRAKTNSIVLNENANNTNGWANCANAVNREFTIPANQVSMALNNYEFRCLVSLNSGDYHTQQATDPVSIVTGYAIADSNIKLNIQPSSSAIVQDQSFSLHAKSGTSNTLNYQWYYKTPANQSGSFAGTNITNTNPVQGWTIIDNAKAATLKVGQQYVTQSLLNTEFMVVGYENDKLTYNIATYKVTALKQVPITVNVTLSQQGPYYVGQSITLNAKAHADSSTQPTFKYEWYYAKVDPNNQANPEWQIISGQTSETLALSNINQTYNNYEFKCKVMNADNSLSCGESEIISLNVQQPERNQNIQINFASEPTTIYPETPDVKIVATASCETIDSFTYKWWYKQKTPSAGNPKTSQEVETPESQGWTSIPCSTNTLAIPTNYVTLDLNNYEFLCEAIATNESWNFNYNTTTIKVEPTPITTPITTPTANPNINVQITGYEDITSGQDLTLTACATCTNPTTITDFSYQWYYKPISSLPSTYFFKTINLSAGDNSEPTDPTEGWTKISEHGNTDKLIIPQNFVNPNLVNYQFMVVAYQTSDNNNFNLSNPISVGPFIQTNIVCNQEIVTNLVNNATMQWTEETLTTNCSPSPQATPITPVIANDTIKNQIAEQLGIFPENIDQIYIEPGSSYYQSKKFKANIKVVLKNDNTFQKINTDVTVNGNSIGVNANGNTLTLTNVLTDIQPKEIGNAVDTKANWEAFQTTITSWDWNGIEKQVGKKLTWTEQLDPLYEAGAKLYGIKKTFIRNIEITFGGQQYNMRNVLRFKFWFKSGVYVNENGQNWSDGTYPDSSNGIFAEAAMSSTATVTNIKGVPPLVPTIDPVVIINKN